MAIPTLNITDSDGGKFIAAVNAALQGLASSFYTSVDPATLSDCVAPLMLWADATNQALKQRNAANTAWVQIGSLNQDGTFCFDAAHTASASSSPYGTICWKTAGTFTFTAPGTKLTIHAGAAGGGGNSNYGLAGGAGQCILGMVVSTIKGETITVNVGTGGKGAVGGITGGSIAAIPASNGGNTTISGSFGTITLIGGFGGCYDGMLNPGQPGGVGGQRGEFCSSYSIDSRYTRHGGRGGDSEFGKGGMGGYYPDNPTTYGNLAHGEKGGPAAGGGGGGNIFGASITATNGGDGGDGIVIFEWEDAA